MAGVQVRAQMRLRGPTASVASVGARPHARGGRTARARPCAPRAVGGESVETVDLDLEEFNDVLSMVHDTDIVELSLKTSSFTLSVRKKEALEAEQQLYAQQAAPVAPVAAAPVAAAAPPPAPAAAPAASRRSCPRARLSPVRSAASPPATSRSTTSMPSPTAAARHGCRRRSRCNGLAERAIRELTARGTPLGP